jgi:oligopeptide transport system ATP-binding protein
MLVRMSDDLSYAALTDAVVRYGKLAAVDGVSLSIRRGETLGLVGESGCGKTSLAKALVGLVPLARGTLVLDGETVTQAQYRQRRWFPDRVQLLYQDAAASLSPRLTVAGQLREPLAITGRKAAADWTAALALLRELGLSEQILTRYPHQLSGGQAKRVALLRALLMQPKLLVADEPTAGLDLSIQGELLNLLKRLQAGRDLTYMIVSHNLNVIGRVTDHILVMYLGQIVESGPTRQVYRQPLHPYTAALLAANPTLGTAGRKRIVLEGEIPSPLDPPAGCRFHTRCPFAQERCRVEVPLSRELAPGQSAACHFPLGASGAVAA